MTIKQIYKFISKDVWRITAEDAGRGKSILVGTIKTLILSVKGYNTNDIGMRANSLSYSMMFAIVPILALIFAIAKGFGFENVIHDFLDKSFLRNYGYGLVNTIMEFVERYLETAQGGAFIGVGIFVLLWAVYSFFRNVEMSFNKIWQVEQSRSILRQFTNYITVLLMIPIIIIASSGASIFMNSHAAHEGICALSPARELILKVAPWVTSWLIFILIYKTIPNTQVKWSSTIFPGILIGTLVQLLQTFSVYIIVFLSRTSVVYGTFAAIPLLLMWLQWTCLMILVGAEMSYAIQNKENFNYLDDEQRMSRRYKDYLTLYICHKVVKQFENGDSPLSAEDIATSNNVPVRIVNQLIGRLVDVRILTAIMPTSEKEKRRFQPALDINKLTVGMVFERIEAQGEEDFLTKLPKEMKVFWEKWDSLYTDNSEVSNILVKDLI
ncbi:MAG: YihY/virulence factor BrkB family protein [Paludibacteraceae bacterium]|nr:YihY/virulence factor BrkB family protein [Paludibacteraceae bacterium]